MNLVETTIDGFKDIVLKNDTNIIIYGAGVIGRVTAPQFICDLRLSDRVLLIVDQDKNKQGKSVAIGDRLIEICSPDILSEVRGTFVILITGSRYQGILETLNKMSFLEKVDGYILPKMLAENARMLTKQDIIKTSEVALIPKKIHYCWFGGKSMPHKMKNCVESWKQFCPDYEIIEWNEHNYDVNKYQYTRQAYQHKKWAFVSDVARLDILYNYGGIYMDTDVELIRGLDDLLYQPGFCGVEKWGVINTGGGCGSVPEHPAIAQMLEKRTHIAFEYSDGSLNLEANVGYETLPLMKMGFIPDNTVQVVDGMTVYSSDFFHPFDYMSKELCITEYTYGIHHFAESWV